MYARKWPLPLCVYSVGFSAPAWRIDGDVVIKHWNILKEGGGREGDTTPTHNTTLVSLSTCFLMFKGALKNVNVIPLRRKISLLEINAKCRYLKN
jgi:hypothetical protein